MCSTAPSSVICAENLNSSAGAPLADVEDGHPCVLWLDGALAVAAYAYRPISAPPPPKATHHVGCVAIMGGKGSGATTNPVRAPRRTNQQIADDNKRARQSAEATRNANATSADFELEL
mmetsp:Transcript_10156/g.28499  ORF Transcript_10156/g.28499 Transcript_10156/m.28499 type:complete len:119 (+) Transcript_10156:27-383(+)